MIFKVLDVYVDPRVGQQKPDIFRCRWFARGTSQMQNCPPRPVPSIHIEIVEVRLWLNRTRFCPRSPPALTGTRSRAGGGGASPLELALERLLITLSKESMERFHARLSESRHGSDGGPQVP